MLVILFAKDGMVVWKILRTRLLVGLGLISYSIYLWHQPLFAFVKYRSSTELSFVTTTLLCLIILPCSYLSWRFIENRFRRREILGFREVSKFFGGSLLLFGVAFTVTHITEGVLPGKYSQTAIAKLASLNENKEFQPFNDLQSRPFDANSSGKRLLIIGDSYA